MLGILFLTGWLIICYGRQIDSDSLNQESISNSYPERGYKAERWNGQPALYIDQSERCEQICLSRCSQELSDRQNLWKCFHLCCRPGSEILIKLPHEPKEQKENQCKAECADFCINNIYIEDCQVKCLRKLCKEQNLTVDISDEQEKQSDTWSMLAYFTLIFLYATGIVGAILYLHRIKHVLNICARISTDSELNERFINV